MKDLLTAYFSEQKEAFLLSVESVSLSSDGENIHQLRLNVKRMRALLSFLNFVKREKVGKPYAKELRKIYLPAGKLRDVQVLMVQLKNYEKKLKISYGKYEAYLKSIADTTYADLKSNAVVFDPHLTAGLETLVREVISDFTDDALTDRVNAVFQESFEKVKLLRRVPGNKRKNMHALRKTLKEIRYFLELFNRPLVEIRDVRIKYSRLKQMEKVLGLWHDQVNGRRCLKKFMKKYNNAGRLESLKREILLQSIRSYEQLLKKRMLLAFDFELHTAV